MPRRIQTSASVHLEQAEGWLSHLAKIDLVKRKGRCQELTKPSFSVRPKKRRRTARFQSAGRDRNHVDGKASKVVDRDLFLSRQATAHLPRGGKGNFSLFRRCSDSLVFDISSQGVLESAQSS